MRSRRALGAAFIATLGVAPSLAHADDILVFRRDQGDFSDQSADLARDFLTALGHNVALVQGQAVALPQLDGFDQVYSIQGRAFPLNETTALVAYVKAGGRLYVTGENPGVQAANTILQNEVVNKLVASGNVTIGTGVQGADLFDFSMTDKVAFASTPNLLGVWTTQAPGLLADIPADNQIATQAGGAVGAAAFVREDLVADAAGCLFVAMDSDFWYQHVSPPDPALESEILDIAENIHFFLKYCGDTDGDGILDRVEMTIGTAFDDPDSDDDGLCDGVVDVPVPIVGDPCIAGEDAKAGQNTDDDANIDALDPDDDNDSLPTRRELTDVMMFGNPDADDVPAWRDLDSDGDGIFDSTEGTVDADGDMIPDYLDPAESPTTSTSTGGEGGEGGQGGGAVTGGDATGTTGTGAGGAAAISATPTGGGIFCAVGRRTNDVTSMMALTVAASLLALRRRALRGRPR